MAPDPPKILANIELQYKVDWPLGAMISSSSLRSYASIHRFLLYFRLTTLELNETWMITRKSTRATEAAHVLLKNCDDVFHKTQSLISAFNEAIVTEVRAMIFSKCRAASPTKCIHLHHCATGVADCVDGTGASRLQREQPDAVARGTSTIRHDCAELLLSRCRGQ